MKKNLKVLLLLLTLTIGLTLYSVEAKKFTDEDQADLVAQTAGVAGFGSYIARADRNMLCLSERRYGKAFNCGELLKSVDRDNKTIVEMIETRFKDLTSLPDDLQPEYKNILEEFNCLSKKIMKLAREKEIRAKLKEEYNGDYLKAKDDLLEEQAKIIEKIDKINQTEEGKQWQQKIRSLVQDRDNLLKQVNDMNERLKQKLEQLKEEESSSTLYDVEPAKSVSLADGDLIAWGIPYVPRIPVPRSRKHTSTSSSSSSTSSQQSQINDETYKALRMVEENSEKITDSEKTEFLNKLNARAAMDNKE